jgi:hypothetical protein
MTGAHTTVLSRAARVNVIHSYMSGLLSVLALWQPHATLCVAPDPENGGEPAKRHETRHWFPLGARPFAVAIHAAKKNDSDNRGYFSAGRFSNALRRCGFYAGDPAPFLKRSMQLPGNLKPLPFGCIIGVARVTTIWTPQSPLSQSATLGGVKPLDLSTLSEDDRAFGHYVPRSDDPHPVRYAWRLEDAIMLPEPIKHVGRQDVLYPVDKWTRDQIDAQLAAMEAAL